MISTVDSILTTPTGDELLRFLPGSEPAPLIEYPNLPLIFSCVIARHHGGALFVYNAWRKEWELPSGIIEAGESPAAAGLRELREESSQVPSSLVYAGLCLLRLPVGKLELGAIYTCELEHIQSFVPNSEASAMMLLWGSAPNVNLIALKLVELTQ